jgi:hypothetical protein
MVVSSVGVFPLPWEPCNVNGRGKMMRNMRFVVVAVFVCAVSILGAADNTAKANLVQNPTFSVSPFGSSTTMSSADPFWGSLSAADGWALWSNGAGTLISDVLPTTDPNGTGNMIRVVVSADRSGLFQNFGVYGSGPDLVQFTVSVYVVSGCVGAGVGDGGYTFVSASTCQQNRWIQLHGRNSVAPANEIIIYSFGGAAEWYAENASIVLTTVNATAGNGKGLPEPRLQ